MKNLQKKIKEKTKLDLKKSFENMYKLYPNSRLSYFLSS